jgi:hypothetical protein
MHASRRCVSSSFVHRACATSKRATCPLKSSTCRSQFQFRVGARSRCSHVSKAQQVPLVRQKQQMQQVLQVQRTREQSGTTPHHLMAEVLLPYYALTTPIT